MSLSHANLGILLDGHHRKPEAEAAYRKAVQLDEALTAEFPKIPEHRQHYYGMMWNLAGVLADQGKKPEAEQTLSKAIEAGEVLVADLPDSRFNHNQLGKMLDELAGWLLERNEL